MQLTVMISCIGHGRTSDMRMMYIRHKTKTLANKRVSSGGLLRKMRIKVWVKMKI